MTPKIVYVCPGSEPLEIVEGEICQIYFRPLDSVRMDLKAGDMPGANKEFILNLLNMNQMSEPINTELCPPAQPYESAPNFHDQIVVFLATALMEISDLNQAAANRKSEHVQEIARLQERIRELNGLLYLAEQKITTLTHLNEYTNQNFDKLHGLHQGMERHVKSLKSQLNKVRNGKPLTKGKTLKRVRVR